MRYLSIPILLISAVACTSFEQPTTTTDWAARMRVEADAAAALASPAAQPRSADTASVSAPDMSSFAPPRAEDDKRAQYTKLRIGWFDPQGDLDRGFKEGWWADVTFGRKLMKILALEGSIGYLETERNRGSNKLWAIPAFVNARASLPILILEPYLGAGLGGMYTEYTGNTDWVFAWQAMAGVGVGLGDLQLGLDWRYVQSGDTDDKFAIEGQSVSLFGSLPF